MSDKALSPTVEQIAAWRQENIGRLFLRAHRDFGARATEKLRARGHHALGLAHTTLLANLDLEGTRITTLADRAGITKQSMGQLVTELEQHGYIERSIDAADRRAIIVKFTDTGWQFLRDAYEIKQEIEAEYTAILGEDLMHKLREALTTLLESSEQARE